MKYFIVFVVDSSRESESVYYSTVVKAENEEMAIKKYRTATDDGNEYLEAMEIEVIE